MAALLQVNEQNGVFPTTFSIESMSLPQLRAAALSPTRFASRYRNAIRSSEKALKPTARRTLQVFSASDPDHFHTPSTTFVFIVAGGKYLLTYGVERRHMLSIWDLDQAEDGVWARTEPLVTWRIAIRSGKVAISPTPSLLRVALDGTLLDDVQNGETYVVYTLETRDAGLTRELPL